MFSVLRSSVTKILNKFLLPPKVCERCDIVFTDPLLFKFFSVTFFIESKSSFEIFDPDSIIAEDKNKNCLK